MNNDIQAADATDDDTATTSDAASIEIAQLRDELEGLRADLARLRAAIAPPATETDTDVTDTDIDATATTSRRGLLRLAGAAAAGAAAAAGLGNSTPAAASSSDNVIMGYKNLGKSSTSFAFGATAATANSVFTTDPNVTNAIVSADGASVSNSIGFFGSGTQWGVLGSGLNAGVASFGRDYGFNAVASLKADYKFSLVTAGTNVPKIAPASRTDAHVRGELDADADGNLWFCTATGTPGAWQAIAGPASIPAPAPVAPTPVGLFHAVGPYRAYDSRAALPLQQPMVSGNARTISIADARNLDTGVVTTLGLVPAGATAISCNVGVVNTVGSGFVTINAGGDATVRSASVNWFGNGQILNNGIIVKISPTRDITAIAGGGGATDLVVDVTGYFV